MKVKFDHPYILSYIMFTTELFSYRRQNIDHKLNHF